MLDKGGRLIVKFPDVIRQANDTGMQPPLVLFRFILISFLYGGIVYGLAAAVFSQNINRAIETAHKLHAGTAWVSLLNFLARKRRNHA